MPTAYRIVFGKPEWLRLFGRPRCRWKENITADERKTTLKSRGWIHLAQLAGKGDRRFYVFENYLCILLFWDET
jgi:hypothetical protein